MAELDLGDLRLHWREDGDPAGRPLVLHHALGCDLTLWDRVLPLLPPGLRLLRYDMRGHGASSVPPAPYSMGMLVRDAERFMEAVGARDAVFCGISIGGLVGQGLAIKRLDLVRALVLSNTAVKIATPAVWAERVASLRADGIEALAEATLARWFAPAFRGTGAAQAAARRIATTDPEGYAGACAAIAGTDFLTPTSGLRLATLVLAGSHDGSTPPDLVRELAELIPGARFALLRKAGHVPPIDAPEAFAAALSEFLAAIGETPRAEAAPPAPGHVHPHHDHDHRPGSGCCGGH